MGELIELTTYKDKSSGENRVKASLNLEGRPWWVKALAWSVTGFGVVAVGGLAMSLTMTLVFVMMGLVVVMMAAVPVILVVGMPCMVVWAFIDPVGFEEFRKRGDAKKLDKSDEGA